MALIHCPECGTQVSDQATACTKCAYPISKLNFRQAEQPIKETTSNKIDVSGLDYYYQQEFEKIHASKESYRGKFNWWAFFFSWIWCFSKGAFAWGSIILVVSTVITVAISMLFKHSTQGAMPVGQSPDKIAELVIRLIFGISIALYTGFNATKIYYNVKIKNKQI